jgi:hypothetical protein
MCTEKTRFGLWSVGLVYDPRGLPGGTTARPRVPGLLGLRMYYTTFQRLFLSTSHYFYSCFQRDCRVELF